MADPVTLGVIITGLVGAYKAYTDYKAAVVKTGEKEVAPTKSAEAAKGEQAVPLVKAAVQQHGEVKDQRALANFEDDTELYEGALKTMLTRLADRSPAFATQLQTLAQQANIQTGGVQGSVNVSGQGKVDQAAGVNTGTMTYNARDKQAE
jgi:hypothetical protein